MREGPVLWGKQTVRLNRFASSQGFGAGFFRQLQDSSGFGRAAPVPDPGVNGWATKNLTMKLGLRLELNHSRLRNARTSFASVRSPVQLIRRGALSVISL